MIALRSGELTEPDGHHLKQSAFDITGKIGMPFDATDEHDSVRIESLLIEKRFDAVGIASEGNYFQPTKDRAPHRGFGNSIVGEHVGLAFGGGGSVASHRGEDERGTPGSGPIVDDRFRDLIDIRDSAASDADGDFRAGGEARIHRRRLEGGGDGTTDIGKGSA